MNPNEESSQPDLNLSPAEIDYLLSTQAIRDQALRVFRFCEAGHSHFRYHPDQLRATVDYVLQVIKDKYPDLKIPFHSRWGHFRVGGLDRVPWLEAKLKSNDPLEVLRTKLDLVITSVLLDAGAGAEWKYLEAQSQKSFSRSEGLGVASFHMFLAGAMSSDSTALQADAKGLVKINSEDIKAYFQVSSTNPLVGIEGRVALLNNLGLALSNKLMFKDSRPGNIIDYLIARYGKTIPAQGVLRAVLGGLGPIWPGRLWAGGVNLGDVWQHSTLSDDKKNCLVPIHKLSQWMSYSIIDAMVTSGYSVTGVDELTGLAEYRNGGLMLDSGLLSFKNEKELSQVWSPDSDLIIEWRALTVYLLDQLGMELRRVLGFSSEEFPLAKVLEGGTWWAGRFLAKTKRSDAGPPLQIKSDGTVF